MQDFTFTTIYSPENFKKKKNTRKRTSQVTKPAKSQTTLELKLTPRLLDQLCHQLSQVHNLSLRHPNLEPTPNPMS